MHRYHGNHVIEKIWNIYFLSQWILNFLKMYKFATLKKFRRNYTVILSPDYDVADPSWSHSMNRPEAAEFSCQAEYFQH